MGNGRLSGKPVEILGEYQHSKLLHATGVGRLSDGKNLLAHMLN